MSRLISNIILTKANLTFNVKTRKRRRIRVSTLLHLSNHFDQANSHETFLELSIHNISKTHVICQAFASTAIHLSLESHANRSLPVDLKRLTRYKRLRDSPHDLHWSVRSRAFNLASLAATKDRRVYMYLVTHVGMSNVANVSGRESTGPQCWSRKR